MEEIYILFDFVNKNKITQGTLAEIKNTIIEIGTENEWSESDMNDAKALTTKEEIGKWVHKNMDCDLI